MRCYLSGDMVIYTSHNTLAGSYMVSPKCHFVQKTKKFSISPASKYFLSIINIIRATKK